MAFKNFKIGKKLTISFSVIIGLFLLASLFQMFMLKELSKVQDESAARAEDGIYIAKHESMASKLYQVIADAVINQIQHETDNEWETITDETEEALITLGRIVDTPEEEALLAKTQKDYEKLKDIFTGEIYPLLYNDNKEK